MIESGHCDNYSYGQIIESTQDLHYSVSDYVHKYLYSPLYGNCAVMCNVR